MTKRDTTKPGRLSKAIADRWKRYDLAGQVIRYQEVAPRNNAKIYAGSVYYRGTLIGRYARLGSDGVIPLSEEEALQE